MIQAGLFNDFVVCSYHNPQSLCRFRKWRVFEFSLPSVFSENRWEKAWSKENLSNRIMANLMYFFKEPVLFSDHIVTNTTSIMRGELTDVKSVVKTCFSPKRSTRLELGGRLSSTSSTNNRWSTGQTLQEVRCRSLSSNQQKIHTLSSRLLFDHFANLVIFPKNPAFKSWTIFETS